MPIIRAPSDIRKKFYTVDKRISEDKRLSWAARGLLIFLLGKPDNWRVSVPALINETNGAHLSSGRDAVLRILKELIGAGYIKRDRYADGSMIYFVREPDTDFPDVGAKPQPENPDPENPDQDFPDVLTSTEKAVSTEKATRTEAAPASEQKKRKPRKQKGQEITLREFIAACKARGEKTMSEQDPIIEWAKDAGVPMEFVSIAWYVFRDRFLDTDKQYDDWRAVFRLAVKNNWYHLWFFDANKQCLLTTAGKQADNVLEAKAVQTKQEKAA